MTIRYSLSYAAKRAISSPWVMRFRTFSNGMVGHADYKDEALQCATEMLLANYSNGRVDSTVTVFEVSDGQEVPRFTVSLAVEDVDLLTNQTTQEETGNA